MEEEEDLELRLRPAGNIFFKSDMRIVPLQNCNGAYGKAVYLTSIGEHINENMIIGEMSDKTIRIDNYNDEIEGIHTYNFAKNYEVIDVKTRKFSIVSFWGLILKKLRGR